jgi:acyl-CoA reductase-like NAD-dependent aldehyde dehydrogenase
MTMPFLQYINGEWVGAARGGLWDLVNPATEETIGQVPFGGAEDARAGVDAASSALSGWSHLTAYDRAAHLERAAAHIAANLDEFAAITTEECGKPLVQARAEWAGAPNQILFAAEEGKRISGRWIPSRVKNRRIDVTYRPVGVVGIITAWNFPVYNVVRALCSALAAGCTVVVKPSEYTPRSAMLVARAFADAGTPAGVVNVVIGEAQPIGESFLADPRCRKVSFTGSTRVGKLLMDGASRTVTKLALEMGGNAPVIVFPDAGDMEVVAKNGVVSKVRNAGQVCVSPQRFYVQRQAVAAFTDTAVAVAKLQVVGNGTDPNTTIGPLINASQLARVEKMVDETVARGARVLVGGGRASNERGYFYSPTVLTDVAPGMPLHEEEVFGPVLPVIPFDTAEDAIAMANSSEYGLAAYVHTADLRTAMRVSEELEYGMVAINDWYVATPEAPFGGMKQSGVGRESGQEGVYEYLEGKTRLFGGMG